MHRQGNAEHILVVDDDEDILTYAEAHLTQAGLVVQRAMSGREALERVQAAPPDAVLLDVLMPELDGFETYAALRKLPSCRELPIVFMTALNEGSAQLRAIELGAHEILFKPLNPHELLIRIRSLFSSLRIRRELADTVQMLGKQAESLGRARKRQDEFVQFCVHDLRSPLTGIISSAEFGMRLPEIPASVRALFEEVSAGGKELSRRVNNILDVLAASEGTLPLRVSRFDAAELCRNLSHSMTPVARTHRSSIVCRAPSGPVWLHADRELLTRALSNLVDNALRHAQNAPIELRLTETANRLEFRVVDSGPGISDADRERIFEKYASLDVGERRPSGLGLAFCRWVALAHQGQISAEPNSPTGACFCLSLPTSHELR